MKSMNKKRVFILAAILAVVGLSGTAFAMTRPTEVAAGDKPPIVKTVENHEERLTNAETRLDDVQTQTNQNSNDIQDLDKRVSSVSQNARESVSEPKVVEKVVTVVEKPAPLDPGDYPITPNNPPPTPQDPWTIVSVTDTPTAHGHYCSYVMLNGKDKGINTGENTPCFAQGSILEYVWRPRG